MEPASLIYSLKSDPVCSIFHFSAPALPNFIPLLSKFCVFSILIKALVTDATDKASEAPISTPIATFPLKN